MQGLTMRLKPALFVIAALALILTGCGSSGNSGGGEKPEPLTKAQLVAQGDQLCKKLEAEAEVMDKAESPEEIADALDKVLVHYQSTLDELKKLTPPEELSAKYQEWLAGNATMMQIFEQLQAAAAKNDEAAAGELSPKMEAQIKKLDQLSKEIGFQNCTRQGN